VPPPTASNGDWGITPALFLGGLGFAIYAITRGGYEAYFDQFHVTLDEVGLSEATVVAKTGVNFVSVLFLITAIALLGLLADRVIPDSWVERLVRGILFPFRYVRRIIARRQEDDQPPPLQAGDGLSPSQSQFRIAEEDLAEAYVGAVAAQVLIRRVLGSGVVRFGAGAFVLALLRRPEYSYPLLLAIDVALVSITLAKRGPHFERVAIWLLVASLLAAGYFAHAAVLSEGRRDAQCALEGTQTRSPLLGLRTEFVNVEGAGQRNSDRFLLLGGDKLLVLYNLRTREPLRVPANGVKLIGTSPSSSRSSCAK
jgi:hypothetical protein